MIAGCFINTNQNINNQRTPRPEKRNIPETNSQHMVVVSLIEVGDESIHLLNVVVMI